MRTSDGAVSSPSSQCRWAPLARGARTNRKSAIAFLTKKALATEGASDDIAAVRHDLPHMPSLGVSSLDSRPPWRHGGLLFAVSPAGGPRARADGAPDLKSPAGRGSLAGLLAYSRSAKGDSKGCVGKNGPQNRNGKSGLRTAVSFHCTRVARARRRFGGQGIASRQQARDRKKIALNSVGRASSNGNFDVVKVAELVMENFSLFRWCSRSWSF